MAVLGLFTGPDRGGRPPVRPGPSMAARPPGTGTGTRWRINGHDARVVLHRDDPRPGVPAQRDASGLWVELSME